MNRTIFPPPYKPLTLTRNIPNVESRLIRSLDPPSVESYGDAIINLETKIEKQLVSMFWKMGIQSTVKTDKFSLPIYGQIKCTKQRLLASHNIVEYPTFYREILREIIGMKCYKIRFYVFIEGEDIEMGSQLHYYFNYYLHCYI